MRRGRTARERMPPSSKIGTAAAVAVAIAATAGGTARAEGGRWPWYEISASGETDTPGAAARLDLDAAIPIRRESRRGNALFLQPGAVLSRRTGRARPIPRAERREGPTLSRKGPHVPVSSDG